MKKYRNKVFCLTSRTEKCSNYNCCHALLPEDFVEAAKRREHIAVCDFHAPPQIRCQYWKKP